MQRQESWKQKMWGIIQLGIFFLQMTIALFGTHITRSSHYMVMRADIAILPRLCSMHSATWLDSGVEPSLLAADRCFISLMAWIVFVLEQLKCPHFRPERHQLIRHKIVF